MSLTIEDSKVEKVVVLGSKPQGKLPDVNVPVVLAANGAVELAVKYRNKYGSYIIGLVPLRELKLHQHICESFIKAQPDEVIIMGGEKKESELFVRSQLKLINATVTVLSHNDVNWKLAKYLGNARYRLAFAFLKHRGLSYLITQALPDFFKKREFLWIHRSTGLGAILYSLNRFKNLSQVILGGINFTEGGHFNGVGQFTAKTAFADKVTIQSWPSELKRHILTTEEDSIEISKLGLWEGEIMV